MVHERIEYCLSGGIELLPDSIVLGVCQGSKIFLTRKFPFAITWALLKSLEWQIKSLVRYFVVFQKRLQQ